jgi:hypothetical protein
MNKKFFLRNILDKKQSRFANRIVEKLKSKLSN